MCLDWLSAIQYDRPLATITGVRGPVSFDVHYSTFKADEFFLNIQGGRQG